MSIASDETTIPAAIVEWCRAELPDLQGGYDYAVAGKDQGLPDVVVEVERAETVREDPRFPYAALQQTWLDVFQCVASIMVENSATAAEELRGFSAHLRAQARRDATLGGRVFMVSPALQSDFVPQFVEYDDGTKGRQVQIIITVGNLVEVTS